MDCLLVDLLQFPPPSIRRESLPLNRSGPHELGLPCSKFQHAVGVYNSAIEFNPNLPVPPYSIGNMSSLMYFTNSDVVPQTRTFLAVSGYSPYSTEIPRGVNDKCTPHSFWIMFTTQFNRIFNC
jgi:hypothetical protein